jgi:hypothetical protein
MAFLTGLVTGLASSVDDRLKKDMLRTQERIDGMAQYRVTRRRAEQERQQKEEKEVEKSLKNLASLVDGDVDKAYQLFVEGGANVDGANEFYKELKLNQRAGKNIDSIMNFQGISNTGTLRDYVRDFVTPISALPISDDEAPAAGLYGALFKPDTRKKVMTQVEEAAPLGEQTERALRSTGVDVDYSQLISAEDYERKKVKEEQEDKTFDMSVEGFEKRIEKLDQDIDLAQKNYDLAQDKFDNSKKTEADRLAFEKEKFSYDQTIRNKQIDIAVARETRDAAAEAGQIRTTELTIEQLEIKNRKDKLAPTYATFEAMVVGNTEELNRLKNKRNPTSKEQFRIKVLEETIQRALDGIEDIEIAEGAGTVDAGIEFSKRSLDSIYKTQFKNEMEAIGLYDSVNDKVKKITEGKSVEYFNGTANAINNMKNQFTENQLKYMGLKKYIEAQQITLDEKIDAYVQEQVNKEGNTKVKVEQVTTQGGPQLVDKATVQQNEQAGKYNVGDIIAYRTNRGTTNYFLYTGQALL